MSLPALIFLVAQSAPFCAVWATGYQSCIYYDVASCQRAAAGMQGMCSPNPNRPVAQPVRPAPAPTIQPYQAPRPYQYPPNPGVAALADAIRAKKQRQREEKAAREAAAARAASEEEAARQMAFAPRPAGPPPLPAGYEPTTYVSTNREPYVLYSCRSTTQKTSYQTTVPAVGCVVIEVRQP